LTFGEAFAPDDEWTPQPADAEGHVVNQPLTFRDVFAPEESATNTTNTTHHASDPDPPDGKAA
jgi:hypothetical protein